VRRGAVVVVSWLLLPLVVASCGTTSTVENRSGGIVEAHIQGGSPGSVYLSSSQHGRFTMRRDDITAVDFPGNLHILGGVALTGLATWHLYGSDTACSSFGNAGTCAVDVVPVLAGLIMAGWGLYVYVRANRAFENRSRPEPDQVMKPRPAPEPPHLPGWRKPDPFADPR
jgi:hypothetical protein